MIEDQPNDKARQVVRADKVLHARRKQQGFGNLPGARREDPGGAGRIGGRGEGARRGRSETEGRKKPGKPAQLSEEPDPKAQRTSPTPKAAS